MNLHTKSILTWWFIISGKLSYSLAFHWLTNSRLTGLIIKLLEYDVWKLHLCITPILWDKYWKNCRSKEISRFYTGKIIINRTVSQVWLVPVLVPITHNYAWSEESTHLLAYVVNQAPHVSSTDLYVCGVSIYEFHWWWALALFFHDFQFCERF